MSRAHRLVVLAALYLSQGLPFGFFTLALPVMLRREGLSLAAIGASSFLLLPWALKWIWGPLVDGFGTRRTWILALQVLTVALLVGVPFVHPYAPLPVLGAGMLAASVLAATQDVATDGLAVSLLDPRDRGLGNGLQVAAYRLGMIVGGSVILVLYDQLGPRIAFLVMAGVVAVATIPVATVREPPRVQPPGLDPAGAFAAFRSIGAGWWAILVVYKSGEAAASAMLKTLLVDAGWSSSQIAGILGFGGSAAGLVGALVGGIVAGRIGPHRAMVAFGVVQALAIASFVGPAIEATRVGTVVAVAVEHVASGMATASLFAAMMDRCRAGHESNDYTLQACVVVLSGGFAAAASGLVADRIGYPGHFAASAVVAAVAVVAVYLWGNRRTSDNP